MYRVSVIPSSTNKPVFDSFLAIVLRLYYYYMKIKNVTKIKDITTHPTLLNCSTIILFNIFPRMKTELFLYRLSVRQVLSLFDCLTRFPKLREHEQTKTIRPGS